MYKNQFFLGILTFLMISACGVPESDVELELEDQNFAIPLINSRLSVSSVVENTEGTSIGVSNTGELTVFYNGDVVEQSAGDIFMPVDTVLPIPIISNFPFPLPITEDGDQIKKAVFGNTNIWFEYENTTNKEIVVSVEFLQFSQNGQVYVATFSVPANTAIVSDTFSLEGVEIETADNTISFNVTAVDSDGMDVSPGLPIMLFDQFDLNYIEGKFNERVFDIDGSFVTVGIFDNWLSGNVSFADPKLTVEVDNGFGLPVEAVFNDITVTTTENLNLEIESSLIDDGIIFTYPFLDEVGTTKNTKFAFDKDNSNIVDLFGQRATKVTYDIDARVNPGNPDLIGFFDRSSFFRIKVAVEVPLEGTINDFLLTTDTDLDISELEDVKTADFKMIFENGFPIDMDVQAYFEDATGNVLDSMFRTGSIRIDGASVGSDLRVTGDEITTVEIPFTEGQLNSIRNATNLRVRSNFDTPDAISEPVYIYNDYGMGIKMGAIVTLK